MNTIWDWLGIEPTTDIKIIKSAYAAAAKKYHPEEYPDEFKQLQQAYKSAMAYAKGGNSDRFKSSVYNNTNAQDETQTIIEIKESVQEEQETQPEYKYDVGGSSKEEKEEQETQPEYKYDVDESSMEPDMKERLDEMLLRMGILYNNKLLCRYTKAWKMLIKRQKPDDLKNIEFVNAVVACLSGMKIEDYWIWDYMDKALFANKAEDDNRWIALHERFNYIRVYRNRHVHTEKLSDDEVDWIRIREEVFGEAISNTVKRLYRIGGRLACLAIIVFTAYMFINLKKTDAKDTQNKAQEMRIESMRNYAYTLPQTNTVSVSDSIWDSLKSIYTEEKPYSTFTKDKVNDHLEFTMIYVWYNPELDEFVVTVDSDEEGGNTETITVAEYCEQNRESYPDVVSRLSRFVKKD